MMSKIPSYLYSQIKQSKRYHSVGCFDGLYLIKLLPNSQYRQKNAAGEVIFELVSDAEPELVSSFAAQELGRLNLDWFDVRFSVWRSVDLNEVPLVFDFGMEHIEGLRRDNFEFLYNSYHKLLKYDLAAMLQKHFGGSWQIFDRHVLKDDLLKIKHDLNVEDGFLVGKSAWDMRQEAETFRREVAEKVERFKSNDLPRIYSDIQSGKMSPDQFFAKFGGV